MAAELIFSGYAGPNSYEFDYEAKVTHDSLADPPQWGNLYIRFNESGTTEVAARNTIPAADYQMAILGFERADTGEYDTFALLGDSDLMIHDVRGIDGEEETTSKADDSADDSGNLTVFDGSNLDQEEIPDLLADDTVTGSVVIQTEDGSTATVQASNLTESSPGVYEATDSSLSGKTVESVRLVPDVQYEQPTQYVSDPGSVNSEQINDRVTQNQELVERIRELEEEANGGGVGSGWPGIPGVDNAKAVFVAIVGVFGGIAALNAASG